MRRNRQRERSHERSVCCGPPMIYSDHPFTASGLVETDSPTSRVRELGR